MFAASDLERSREIQLRKVVIIIIFMNTHHLNPVHVSNEGLYVWLYNVFLVEKRLSIARSANFFVCESLHIVWRVFCQVLIHGTHQSLSDYIPNAIMSYWRKSFMHFA